jgi:hypothetical protein
MTNIKKFGEYAEKETKLNEKRRMDDEIKVQVIFSLKDGDDEDEALDSLKNNIEDFLSNCPYEVKSTKFWVNDNLA